ncbi:respiratory nitrate reductase subunit gamma [Actinomadura madurae]|uniref:respiratory nitrate reductase subunit gamma n=1 Tax=Actinomadura madurae TaxID=1993 RepID=UPI002026B69C|nr:respiratory nitrate reductase subunit gamma [Actinomadura madurae]MCP9949605.1 respiratory nitrate reductase subunit gamma [Actinomadura madurae]MCP9966359.1 respiratory nitrate reductase subunit gamma [Actinomadura madurae]MCP9978848.1 respiratory nitrate reductase subunit gamma [Actinomadura madurae]MCQ0009623.1 respiratory nitrate reductase subunit gamma [Actinomadura madurae]MCQ0015037.1 respiratory nitrate reductase subunit gamma [Actinomadura madurae]
MTGSVGVLAAENGGDSGVAGILLWVVLPYVTLAVFVLGHIWRYRYDKFGWTTRSSQLYERRLLRIGSPLFHFGILVVLLGHVGGLVIPDGWTEAAGITEHMYHVVAVVLGTIAGFCTLAGLAILIYRRRTVGPVFSATTRNDKLMYAVLALTIVLGLAATVAANIVGGGYNYRETVSPWFRSIFYFQPDPDLMTGVPILFQLHALSALALFCVWPFTRLVHMLTAPLGYLTRPYIVYRSRDEQLGMHRPRRGWEQAR